MEEPTKVRFYQCEVAFALPDETTDEELDKLRDRLATQYADVASVMRDVCNPPLITLTFSDMPTAVQMLRMAWQIEALLNWR